MGDNILHILSANGAHEELLSAICKEDRSLLKARNARNETPFHHAARFGQTITVGNLIKHAYTEFNDDGLKELLRQKNCLGDTALHEAARHGHRDVVCSLMEADPELAAQVNNDLVSPLYLATARASLDVVQAMVAQIMCTSQIEITPEFYSGPNQQTALHAAVLQQPELTKELLKLYSEPFGKRADDKGRTPLHFIALLGHHNLAKLLLDTDSSLAYLQDLDGSFPVHIAARMGHVEMLALLLQRCLDSGELLDHTGRNFLHVAIESKMLNVILKLLDSKKKIPVCHWTKRFNRMMNTIDNNGNTPLHIAGSRGNIGIIYQWKKKNLLDLDLSLPNKDGLTALDLSAIRIKTTFVTTHKGADICHDYYTQTRGGHLSTGWFQYYIKHRMSKAGFGGADQVPKTELRGISEANNLETNQESAKAISSSDTVMTRAQIVGLGSVLIATGSFAASFTLPGGTNQDTGKAILGGKYSFKAFLLANFSAFFFSFLSTLILIYSSIDTKPHRVERLVRKSLDLFTIAAKCMVMALALGLYVVLPNGNTVNVITVFSFILICFNNPFSSGGDISGFIHLMNLPGNKVGRLDRFSSLKKGRKFLYFIYKSYQPIIIPMGIVFLLALL